MRAHSGTTVMCENDAAGELAILWLPVHGSCQSTVWCMHMAMRRLGYTPIERRIMQAWRIQLVCLAV